MPIKIYKNSFKSSHEGEFFFAGYISIIAIIIIIDIVRDVYTTLERIRLNPVAEYIELHIPPKKELISIAIFILYIHIYIKKVKLTRNGAQYFYINRRFNNNINYTV